MLLDRDGRLAAQAELFTAQLAAQAEQIAALKASNEQFALHFEFLKKRRQWSGSARSVKARSIDHNLPSAARK